MAVSESSPSRPLSQLCINNSLDARDELDQKWEKSHQYLMNLVSNLSEREAHDTLSSTVCKGQQEYEDVTVGLLYIMLTDENAAPKAYRDMNLLSRDALTLAFTKLNQLIVEKYIKLQIRTRNQIIWLLTEFVKNTATGADTTCFLLLRRITGGDVSRPTLDLAEALLNLFTDHKSWLFSYSFLTAAVVYVYLRLILDHSAPPLHHLMQREIEFCSSVLRERFTDCLQIGRDLVRLLQAVAQIPAFNAIWKDILFNPRILSPRFTGLSQLLAMRTSRKFLISRITPDMENKLVFLTSKVKLGHQKKYQEWFHRKYLANPESQALLCDIIRYICGVIHPTNEILGSDIIPRWAVIGWLLQSCQNNATSANAKLTLFFDWICYQQGQENIMNIEPGILIMFHSIRSHITITATLLDFLCRIITSFYKPLETQIRTAVRNSLQFVVEKRVLNSLTPLFDHQKLDKELKEMLQYNFPELFTTDAAISSSPTTSSNNTSRSDNDSPSNEMMSDSSMATTAKAANATSPSDDSSKTYADEDEVTARFSDSEDEEHESRQEENSDNKYTFKPIIDAPKSPLEVSRDSSSADVENDPNFAALKELNLREEMLQLLAELNQSRKDKVEKCELIDTLFPLLVNQQVSNDALKKIATYLAQSLVVDYRPGSHLLDEDKSDESVAKSLYIPHFAIIRNVLDSQAAARKLLSKLLYYVIEAGERRMGYMVLFYVRVNYNSVTVYEDYVQDIKQFDKSITLESCLSHDLRICGEDDRSVFSYILPSVLSQFKDALNGQLEIIKTVVSYIDPTQLFGVCHQISLNEYEILGTSKMSDIIVDSLKWDCYEQNALWQLVQAEDPSVDSLVPVLSQLNVEDHPEATAGFVSLMKTIKPYTVLVQLIISTAKRDNKFLSCIFSHWSKHFSDETIQSFVEILENLGNKATSKQTSVPSTNKELALRYLNFICSHNSQFLKSYGKRVLIILQDIIEDTNLVSYDTLRGIVEGELKFNDEDTLAGKRKKDDNDADDSEVIFIGTGRKSTLREAKRRKEDME